MPEPTAHPDCLALLEHLRKHGRPLTPFGGPVGVPWRELPDRLRDADLLDLCRDRGWIDGRWAPLGAPDVVIGAHEAFGRVNLTDAGLRLARTRAFATEAAAPEGEWSAPMSLKRATALALNIRENRVTATERRKAKPLLERWGMDVINRQCVRVRLDGMEARTRGRFEAAERGN